MELVDRFLKINDVNTFVPEIYRTSSMMRSFILFKRPKRTNQEKAAPEIKLILQT